MAVECYWFESSSDWQPFCCVLNSIKELKCRTPDFKIEDERTEKIGSQLLSTWYMPGTVTAPLWAVTHLMGHMRKQKPGEGKAVPRSRGSQRGRWSAAITWLLEKACAPLCSPLSFCCCSENVPVCFLKFLFIALKKILKFYLWCR